MAPRPLAGAPLPATVIAAVLECARARRGAGDAVHAGPNASPPAAIEFIEPAASVIGPAFDIAA